MAFSLNLTGISWGMGKYSLEPLPFTLGTHGSLWNDPRFREINQSSGYLDFVAILTPAEVLDMARAEWKPDANPGARTAHLQKVEQALRTVTFVFAHIYEWESGLG